VKAGKDQEVLVVGAGIAGILLSWFLRGEGVPHRVVDDDAPGSASPIAAGIINPITGRSLTLAPDMSDTLHSARTAYGELGSFLGRQLWEPREVITLLRHAEDRSKWMARADQTDCRPFLGPDHFRETAPSGWHAPGGTAAVHGAAQVDLRGLLQAYRSVLEREGMLIRQPFLHGELQRRAGRWWWGQRAYTAVVFCEGYRAHHNPWLRHMPWRVNRGSRLLLELDGTMPTAIMRQQGLLAPLSQGLCWLGSHNDWNQDEPQPAPGARDYLLRTLKGMWRGEARVLDLAAGIRPVLRDRRPVAGWLGEPPGLAVLNGLGTKGSSLAPRLARALAASIARSTPMPEQVSPRRFNTFSG
jgi:glycine/D-amino acid oxidase-like deaminating enzyme